MRRVRATAAHLTASSHAPLADASTSPKFAKLLLLLLLLPRERSSEMQAAATGGSLEGEGRATCDSASDL